MLIAKKEIPIFDFDVCYGPKAGHVLVNEIAKILSAYKDPITICLGFLTISFSVYVILKARRDSKTQAQLQYKSQLRTWADEAIEAVSEAMFLTELDPSRSPQTYFEKRHELIWSTSALIDRGRLFLPNENRDLHGQHKAPAFQGFRKPALDWLVLVHNLCRALDYIAQSKNKDLREPFERCRKAFVSEIQAILDSKKDIDGLGRLLLVETDQDVKRQVPYGQYLEMKNWIAQRQSESKKAVMSAGSSG